MRASRFVIYIAICLLAVLSGTSAPAINILMVTRNSGSLTTAEADRKAQMEAWGYTVNTIWDAASQASFNTAFTQNRAVYLPDESTSGQVGYILRFAPIGVMSEHPLQVDQIGFSSSSTTTTLLATVTITNNTHYITSVFPTGIFSLGSSVYNVGRLGGTTAPGATLLATVAGSNSAIAIETGAMLANTYNGNNVALARRAQFPLPVSINNSSTFSGNTFTLARRMLEWTAGLDRTLVAHWKLNETSGTAAADSSGFDRTGTVTGTATWTPAVINNGFAFNGATQIQATGLLGSHANLTVAAWANLTAADTGGAEIISLGDHFCIRLDESGWARAYMYNGSTWLSVGVFQTFAGTGWHHFAAVFDDANNTFKLYIDGALAASTTNTSSISYAGLGANTVIGRNGNGGTSHDFTGIIDGVRVYNYALSDTEVATIYGFIGHWKLNETTGTTAADSTFFARHGTVNGSGTWSTRCNGDGAFEFNGTSQYISIPDAAHLRPTEALTIAAWVRGDSWTSGDVVNLILRKGEENPNNWQLAIGNNGRVVLSLDAFDPAPIQGNTVLAAGQWYHVAATWDGAFARIYVNGQLDNSPVARSGTIGTDTRPVYIGGRSGVTDFFDGMIYDVRFYNRALNASDVAKLAGLWGHWKFAEGTGSSAADSSGVGNNATLTGGATWMTDCAGNKALATNGAGGIAQTVSTFTPPEAGTVAFWMQSNGNPPAVGRLFGTGNDWEARQMPNGVVVFDLCGEGNGNFLTTRPLVETGRWYHVAASFDSANDSYQVYIDGQLDKSGTNSNGMTKQAAAILSFGTRTGSSEYWQGALRDFRVYSRKLCASEIVELYGLIGHWKLDETSGILAADSSGLGRHGTVIGTATWTSGSVDNALQLNGLTRVEVNGLKNPRNITLTAWAYISAADSGGAEVVSLGDYFGIRLNSGTASRAFFYNGFTWVPASVNQTFTPGWHHFAAVFNDELNVCKFFVDGAEVASVATTVTIPYGGLGTKLVIGAHGNGQTTMDFTGMVDDVRVYNRALCNSEVADIEQGGEPFGGVKIIKWVEIQ
jgi:Concanavalin A-like lectin/glucanases superfamily